jgi:2-polyprenyl-3-methyl-5-hydroxy-6-metoxy-1,4-benzoquinol methylase
VVNNKAELLDYIRGEKIKMKMKCPICCGQSLMSEYEGPIRSGGVGSPQTSGYKVMKCRNCDTNFLSPFPERTQMFYESDVYRREYDNTIDEAELTRKYEYEQNDRIHQIGLENIRGKVIADFGTGIGLFLDAVKGVAGRTIAVEPMQSFKDILMRKGHQYYEYPDQLDAAMVDIGACFDVLEHIDDPFKFLASVRRTMKKNSIFYIAVPNKNDILMHVQKEVAAPFLYCTAHLFYFSGTSLSYLLDKSGFSVLEEKGMHKYDFYNLISWLKLGKPCGRKRLQCLDEHFEAQFKSELIRMELSSHIFIKAAVKE